MQDGWGPFGACMRAVCAWCGVDLRRPEPPENHSSSHVITHGICEPCQKYFFSPRDNSLRGFLNTLTAPVVVVDDDMHMLDANDHALTALGKTRDATLGLRSGEVIECANARLPGGCGKTVHCAACTLRNSVRETFETGEGFTRVPAWIRLGTETVDESQKRMRVMISTEKVGNVVMLRIDDIRKPAPPTSAASQR